MEREEPMSARLDFEFEDPLMDAPAPAKRRKKVFGLDDLLADFYKEKGKRIEGESKKKKVRKNEHSDDEENIKEATLSTTLDQYHKQMKEMGGDDEISHWGLRVFESQKCSPPLVFPELEHRSCMLLDTLNSKELISLVSLGSEEGSFLEGLLVNGWLSKLIIECRHVELAIATWTFNLMMFSSKEELRRAACNFWCGILSQENEEMNQQIKIDWIPNCSELKKALDIYGFTFNFSPNSGSIGENNRMDSTCVGPSHNIRTWIRFVTAAFQARRQQPIFFTVEAEELTEVIIFMFLDHQLEGLSMPLHKCILSAINYFSDEEWDISYEKIAKSIADRIPRDVNCLRVVECICDSDTRSKRLRSEVAYQILKSCLNFKAANPEEILSMLISINIKEKSCDLFKVYIYLVLSENWLSWKPNLEEKQVLHEMWGVYLRNCSCLITSTDLRSYASKVRNRASFILQGSLNK